MPSYPCDLCQEEQAILSMNNMTDGSVQFVGVACLPLIGASLIQGLDAPVLDAVLKSVGYQPTKATRDARKEAEAAEFDPNRVVAQVIEDQPRPPESNPDEITVPIVPGDGLSLLAATVDRPPARIDTAPLDQANDDEPAVTDETREQWGSALDSEAPEYQHPDGDEDDDLPPY